MIENDIKQHLMTRSIVTDTDCILGAMPTSPDNVVVISTSESVLDDKDNTITAKLSTPRGTNDVKITTSVTVRNTDYATGSAKIWQIFNELGGEFGGFKICNNTHMFITPVQTPYFVKEDTGKKYFVFNMVITTPCGA